MSAQPESAGPRRARMPQLLFLGICPLLASSTTLLSAACMGAAAALVLCASAGTLTICRRAVPAAAPLVFLVLLTAAWTSVVDLVLQYGAFPLRQGLGIYLPLIAANCLVLSTLEERVLREGTGAALARSCAVGAWMILCVTAVGTVRELSATGGLLGDVALLGFESAAADASAGLAIMRAPAGAFLTLGLLAALLQAFTHPRVAA